MSETTGPSTTIPANTESSSSQAAYTPSPVRQQQPQVSDPMEHAAHRSGPSLTTERVQDVAGFDKSSQAAPVQGQNMATGGFRSSSGVPSEDELAQLYSNEDGAQVSIDYKEVTVPCMPWSRMCDSTGLNSAQFVHWVCSLGLDLLAMFPPFGSLSPYALTLRPHICTAPQALQIHATASSTGHRW